MAERRSLNLLILVVVCLLSETQAQNSCIDLCPDGVECHFDDSSSPPGCKCDAGYDGDNCEKNICNDLPSSDVYQCETSSGDPICIRTDKICSGNATHRNEDCPENGEDELRCVDDDYNTCVGPIRWCDGIEDCKEHGNNDDENECCVSEGETETTCPADETLDKCGDECVPKCDGKNDTCVKFHGPTSQNRTCIEYSDLDEQGCEKTCANDGDIQCFNANNNPLPLICLPPEMRCDGVQNCTTFGEDEEACGGGIPWWVWLIVVILILLILALIIWYCCKKRNKKDPIKDKLSPADAGSEESQPINQPDEDVDVPDHRSPQIPSPERVENGTILPPSPITEIPPEDSPKKPCSPPPNFDWEKAAQNIVKNNRKNTAHIHIPPENGFLMTEFPKDRIHEDRSVSPQPPVPTVQYAGPTVNYPQMPERQVSETGEVVRFAGPTGLPVVVNKESKSKAKTRINYADPKDQ